MKLEFESGVVPESLQQELDFQGYLDLFAMDLALIPHFILRPLDQKEADGHFQRLAKLETQLSHHHMDLKPLVQHCQSLPAVDYLLPFFESKQLEPYHLYDLGRFVQEEGNLEQLEECIPLRGKADTCRKILSVLWQFLTPDFGSLKLSPAEFEEQQAINRLNEEIGNALNQYEQELYQTIELKLVYPFPKEIPKDHQNLDKIKNCPLVRLIEKDHVYLLEYVLTEIIGVLVKKKDRLQQAWEQRIRQKVIRLNLALGPNYQPFLTLYHQRKNRCFDYILLLTRQKHGLSLPRFTSDTGIRLEAGVLPLLKKQEPEHYRPLDIVLQKGVNLLFGANMTGKTTVLKTLYFHLTLLKFGLPVPAKAITLEFPDEIRLHLRSSGHIGSGLSGFGEELRFFCETSQQPSLYLIDELFHSTDPVNGVKLSEAFLTGLTDSNSVYLCTSHYPDVLTVPNITFFKMKDIEDDPELEDLDRLLKQVPFVVEPLSAESTKTHLTHSDKPLRIALRFPLPETIKQNIRKKLEK